MEYSCYVKVDSVKGQDFGALATLVFEQGGGIDISPEGPMQLHVQDAAQLTKPGATLKLTLSDEL